MAHHTDLDKFKTWYNEFVNRYAGFKTSDKWAKRVEETHQAIRNKIGGVRVTLPIELKDVVPAVNFDEIDKLTHELFTIIPKYFYDYRDARFSRKDFCVPSVVRGDQAGTKWGKHIQTWCKRNDVPKEKIDRISKIMSTLGESWARSKTQKVTMYVTLTTDPKAFCMIGHYGVDNMSCFKQGGCNQLHKYMIGQTPNTYVVLVSSEPDGFECIQDDPNAKFPLLARYWGAANGDLDIFGLVNWYQKKSEPEGNVYNATELFFAQLLGVDKAKKYNNQITVPPVFQNKVVNWCLCKPEKLFAAQAFPMTQEHLNNIIRCPLCQETFSYTSEGKAVDTQYVCNDCISCVQTCQHSGRLTLKPLIKAIGPKGNELMISDHLIGERVYIEFEGQVYHNTHLIKLENNHFIRKDMGDGYHKCSKAGCSTYINNKEDRTECNKCRKAQEEMSSITLTSDGDWLVEETNYRIKFANRVAYKTW